VDDAREERSSTDRQHENIRVAEWPIRDSQLRHVVVVGRSIDDDGVLVVGVDLFTINGDVVALIKWRLKSKR